MKKLHLDNYWMPFTANRNFKSEPRIIEKAEGFYYYDQNGKKIIDASSGLFCVGLGHCRKEIADAISQQAATLDYCSPFNSSHSLGFKFSAALCDDFLPPSMSNVFFSNSGSESVDTAMKMAVAYHAARKESQRTVFISRQKAYHGVNLGGVSLSGLTRNRDIYNGITCRVHHLKATLNPNEAYIRDQSPVGGEQFADELEQIALTIGHENIAAVFIEPVAGSTGIIAPPKGYLERLRKICDKYGILLIFDEVITGFCRLGSNFAAQKFGVEPDIMTMAKALTNASVPMGATACRKEIYDTVLETKHITGIEFFHGYTYSAHPLACVAGIKSLEIMKEEKVVENVASLMPYFLDRMLSFADKGPIVGIRGIGLMAGIDFKSTGTPGETGVKYTRKFFENGLHVKFTGDTAIFAPPLVSKKEHVDEICDIIEKTIAD